MEAHTPDFSLDVQGVKGFCPVGEAYAKQQLASKRIPVLSCEGPCIRGEIARLAANLIAQEVPSLARACHAEAFFVPHSAMASWVKGAHKIIMIDGCFLKCHGRVLKKLTGEENVVHIEALPLYKKYTDSQNDLSSKSHALSTAGETFDDRSASSTSTKRPSFEIPLPLPHSLDQAGSMSGRVDTIGVSGQQTEVNKNIGESGPIGLPLRSDIGYGKRDGE